MRGTILGLHVAAGAVALALGPLAVLAARRRLGPALAARDAYHWAVLAVCLTAVGLSALAWTRLWWLVPVAAVSYGLALVGYLATVRGWPSAVRVHGWGGSYIALVTALLVVSLRNGSTVAQVLSWVLPISAGQPLIFWADRDAQRRSAAAARP